MSDNIENQTGTMKLDVNVRPVAPKNNLLAWATVTTNDCFRVDGFKVVNGENGMFVDMPSTQNGDGKYRDVCFPVTADFRKELINAILDGYDVAIEKMQAAVQAAEKAQRAPMKSSINEQIKGTSKTAQEHSSPKVNRQRQAAI